MPELMSFIVVFLASFNANYTAYPPGGGVAFAGYDAAEACMSRPARVNSQLDVWEAFPDNTQTWVSGRLDDANKSIRGLSQRIRNATKELKSSR